MSVTINQATGEVTAEMLGETIRFHGTNERMAEMERVLGITGLQAVYEKLALQSAPINVKILATLCSSGHKEADFNAMPFGLLRETVTNTIISTITGALPERDEEEKRGNGAATRATGGRRGNATAKSPLAS